MPGSWERCGRVILALQICLQVRSITKRSNIENSCQAQTDLIGERSKINKFVSTCGIIVDLLTAGPGKKKSDPGKIEAGEES